MGRELPSDDRRCTAKAKSTGERCRRAAIHGANVCPKHGGSLPQVKRKAKERLRIAGALEQANREMHRYGGHPVKITSIEALDEELCRSAASVRWLQQQLDGAEDPLVGLYLTERAHLVKIAAACVAAGLEERRVQLAEAQAGMIATVIRAALTEGGYADDPNMPAIVARHLRAVS